MTIILVEGESDRVAVEILGARLGLVTPPVLAIGGSKGARRTADEHAQERLLGLVDMAQRHDFERVLDTVFICDPDLEAEFVRALGVRGVESVIEGQRELESFRRLQLQPAQRSQSPEQPARPILRRPERKQAAIRAAHGGGGAAGSRASADRGPARVRLRGRAHPTWL